mgnify:CR=1 FL=1|jgi:hypothetical protein
MEKGTIYRVLTLADYLAIRYKEEYKEDISIIKINKVLYFLFAYWGAFVKIGKKYIDNMELKGLEDYSEYLFNAEFVAGVYGPYMKNLLKINNKYLLSIAEEKNFSGFIIRNRYNGVVFKLLDPLIRDLFEVSEYDLMDISKKDEEYKRARDNNYGIMNNENITDEYCKTMF